MRSIWDYLEPSHFHSIYRDTTSYQNPHSVNKGWMDQSFPPHFVIHFFQHSVGNRSFDYSLSSGLRG